MSSRAPGAGSDGSHHRSGSRARVKDVILKLGMTKIPANASLLTAASALFESCLASLYPAASTEGPRGDDQQQDIPATLELTDPDPEAFKQAIRFVHKKDAAITTIGNAVRLLATAQRWQFDELSKTCLTYLYSHVKAHSAPIVLATLAAATPSSSRRSGEDPIGVAEDNLRNELSERCQDLVAQRAGEIFGSQSNVGWNIIPANTLVTLLTRDDLAVDSEMEVHNACVAWATEQCVRSRLDPTPGNLRNALGPAVYLIRYLTMTPREFREGPLRQGLLTPEEINPLLAKLEGEESVPLPPCFANTRQHIKRRSSKSKSSRQSRILNSLGDFAICVIQVLD